MFSCIRKQRRWVSCFRMGPTGVGGQYKGKAKGEGERGKGDVLEGMPWLGSFFFFFFSLKVALAMPSCG